MEVRVLGPLEVLIDGNRLDLGGHRQQIVFASLALEANRVVPVGRLMEAIYGDDLPSTSRAQVQICVSALRRLFNTHDHPDTIVTRSQGYLLRVTDGDLDLDRFVSLVEGGRRARSSQNFDEAVRHSRAALALWRGRALYGLESRLVQSAANRLDERRINLHEDCVELELELGRHRDLIPELSDLVEQHPLRERLRGQLMLALYRSGRQAEALGVYRQARRTMIDELGLEPNQWLQQLEHAILTSDEELAAPVSPAPAPPSAVPPAPISPAPPLLPVPVPPALVVAPVDDLPLGAITPPVIVASTEPVVPVTVPCLLPTDIADFTGRSKQIDVIEQQLLMAAESPTQFAVPIVVAAGKPGIGKTTLAVHVAHRAAARYPDGQLFADMHGRSPQRVGPMQVLERFLRTLGVPGTAMPEVLEERAELYRDLLSDRRMLIVLDNVAGESQVLPLLPGTPHSAVLVTSRSRLAGLPGAIHLDVDVFDEEHSLELLAHVAGRERIDQEPAAAAQLAYLCGNLPLALRIAGARLSARQHWTVEHLVERLDNEARRLDELKHSGMGIRASISLTYDSLTEEARRLFRRLAVLDVPSFSGWVSAALLDEPVMDAQDLLDDLAEAQLVESTSMGPGQVPQYRFHDLIRVFARERLAAEETVADRNAALCRVLGALLFLAEAAHCGLHGGAYFILNSDAPRWPLPDRLTGQLVTHPLNWFERERHSLVAGVRQAAQAGFTDLCWTLAHTAVTLFEPRIYLNDWRETHRIALAASLAAGDSRGQAAMLYSNGSLCLAEQRFDEARRDLEAAGAIFRGLGDEQGLALVTRNIAFADRIRGDLPAATTRYEHALASFRRSGDLGAAAYVLHSLAQVHTESGNPHEALSILPEALALSRSARSRRVEAQVLHRMGDTYLNTGDALAAASAFAEALAVVQDIGDPVGEAYALHGMGVAHMTAGDLVAAETALHSALSLASTAGERLIEARVSLALGELALERGYATQAVVHLHRALGLFRGIRAPKFEQRVLTKLTEAYVAAGGRDHPASVAAEPVRDNVVPLVRQPRPQRPDRTGSGSSVVQGIRQG
ncbi:BTAD domain-containing putative transcriptional regulator [Micromonospora zamorensis]|uniref:Tetratricopeptide repeat protein n=1 Tax=Micromonospora zamorensis TaxID=709883 RepID=A0ABZ1PP94_9ACTN|nr:BTAD domain-containing putative transcriptional regulator [Micromonospora zamorensis]WSK48163.1 tetratricopeptide repeat protein [Micromonospora zamorensis]WTE89086.1 tetratricopeptide repeat protein [Micromonospora zamorensis]SCG46971.1 DNA-binding transcriptional activator of the SARP family [Micromonospora zamorensis]